ncbi:hypothetical protein BH11MYX1_BH11MYX1_09060 [soil metagenome]
MQDRVAPKARTDAPAAESAAVPKAVWQRALTERLAQNATPHDLATYLASHREHQSEAMAFIAEHMGNAFVQKVVAATPTGPLTGQMLVSNNPEGISTPGVVMSAHAQAGSLGAYIHHSNHTKRPLDMFLVVKPSSGPVNATLSGASASTGGSKHADGGRGEWGADPNVVVAAASEAAGDAKDRDSHNRTNITQHATGATPIKLGTLPAGGAGDPPLFDARYDVALSGEAELTVVAGDPKSQTPATGNTKYEFAGTNGRAAGMYEGASFATDDTALVSKLPFKKPLTGSKFAGAPSPKVSQAQRTITPSDATLAARPKGDAGAVYVLEHAFRIAPTWLHEKGVWDGTHLTTNGLTPDYASLITELKSAKDDAAIKAVIAAHPDVGAGLDAASYGTMFNVGVLIDNDTKAAATVSLDFLTDAVANRAGKEGAVFRGVVSVDGVDHAINNDTASHHANHSVLESTAIAAGHSKYVHVHFQSPGQISAGQELDIKKK